VITRTKVSIAALALTAGLAACAGETSPDAAQLELQRDLQMASATTMNLASPPVDSTLLGSMETQLRATPQTATTVRKGPGTRAVQSAAPTVLATPDVDVAAVEESSEVETESIAPAPEESSEPVAIAPRPAPVVVPASGDYGSGGGIFGGGSGRGVVIRGGGVDGDNCELHRGRGGIPTSRGPVYIPSPTVPRTGGIFGGSPMTGPRRGEISHRPVTPRTSLPSARGGYASGRTGGFSSSRTRIR
jgi:hypothetical protein